MQHEAAQSSAGQSKARQGSAVQHNRMQCDAVQCSAVQCRAVPRRAASQAPGAAAPAGNGSRRACTTRAPPPRDPEAPPPAYANQPGGDGQWGGGWCRCIYRRYLKSPWEVPHSAGRRRRRWRRGTCDREGAGGLPASRWSRYGRYSR